MPQPKALRPGDAFATVQAAVFARQRLRVTYRARQAATMRELVVEAHGLVSAGSDWYLCASHDKRVRFFKVARIASAALTAEPCSGPDVDVAEAWREHRARFLDRFTPVMVYAWVWSVRWEDAREWTIGSIGVEAFGDAPGDGWLMVSIRVMSAGDPYRSMFTPFTPYRAEWEPLPVVIEVERNRSRVR